MILLGEYEFSWGVHNIASGMDIYRMTSREDEIAGEVGGGEIGIVSLNTVSKTKRKVHNRVFSFSYVTYSP